MTNIEELIVQNASFLERPDDLAPLIEKIKDKKIVMLGESSHGTHEFYEWRRLISQELIQKHGFSFIAVEGDWPPSMVLNNFIKHGDSTISKTLKSFNRWPTWMWANTEIIKLGHWLQDHNLNTSLKQKVGFHGLDVYSLFDSMDMVVKELMTIDPDAADKARNLYTCFDPYQRNEKRYAKSLFQIPEGCKKATLKALDETLKIRLKDLTKYENLFDAQQNARIVKNAEAYYSTMIHGDEDSWNVRDRHMMETLNHLLRYYGPHSKAIVWAHNTHIGDHRATDMVSEGLVNLGGIAREQWGHQLALVGFSTYEGDVMASRAWDGKAEVMRVPPGRDKTYEKFFHNACETLNRNTLLMWLEPFSENSPLTKVFGHRAIGVVYNPEFERGNYVPTALSQRYDAFIFVDRSNAIIPIPQDFAHDEIPETWPRGQ
ncbi:MAG: erythromycin esterase family protein [Pseudobdellovibrio sp.]|nr:erythromycin esterase family protein [Pseudobdellovibrio sp.]